MSMSIYRPTVFCIDVRPRLLANIHTRRTVLDRGSRSDRPHYCVNTTVLAGHWPVILTCDFYFQSRRAMVMILRTEIHVQTSVGSKEIGNKQ